jgi:hypothetical protein
VADDDEFSVRRLSRTGVREGEKWVVPSSARHARRDELLPTWGDGQRRRPMRQREHAVYGHRRVTGRWSRARMAGDRGCAVRWPGAADKRARPFC